MKKLISLFLILFSINVYSQSDTIKLDVVSVSGYQAYKYSPVTYTDLDTLDMQKNYGQEPSKILQNTPSITSYSDAGSDWGYSYFRMRGIDQTRINMTLNGVPMNEPEDQGCYFSNYPGISYATDKIQIQRGSGMTKNGVSSFAGSINLETIVPDSNKTFVNIGTGSYNSLTSTIQLYRIKEHNRSYYQFSGFKSDGYKNRSGNKSGSIFYFNQYSKGKNNIKFVSFIGSQMNELAWIGSPLDSIEKNPKHNGCSEYENDNFSQLHTQLHYTYKINNNSNIKYTLYYNYLKGYYTFDLNNFLEIPGKGEIYKYSLHSNLIGNILNYNYVNPFIVLNVGLHESYYRRTHNGSEETLGDLYSNYGNRGEYSAYVKPTINVSKNIKLYSDVQYRISTFDYVGGADVPYFQWNFLNYNLGINYKLNKNNLFYYSVGKTNREPTRNDIAYGSDDIYYDSTGTVYSNIQPESVIDNEIGFRHFSNVSYININIYNMLFNNEITLNGQVGTTGLSLHENVDESYRRGIEIDLMRKIDNFTLVNNSSYNDSKIIQSNNITIPILTPKFIINQEVHYKYKKYSYGISYRYQSESYIDFSNTYTIPEFNIFNFIFGYSTKKVDFRIYLNNITNEKYYTMGQMNIYGTKPLYFRQSPSNVFVNIKFKL